MINKLILCGAAIMVAALAGCAGTDVAVNAPDGSARGFCQPGLIAMPTLCFVRAAAGETIIRSANGSEDASAFLSGAGNAAAGAGLVLYGARYRPDVTNASAPTTVDGARTSVAVSNSARARSVARSRSVAHASAVARQRQFQAQAQHQRQAQHQHEEQVQAQEQRQRQKLADEKKHHDKNGW